MKITFLPKTKQGKWSVILMVISWVLFAVGSVLPSKPDYSGFEIIIQNPIQSILTIIMFAAAVSSLVTAWISTSKKNERSILVFIAILSSVYNIIGFFGSIIGLLI